MSKEQNKELENFQPRGAIAFFVLLLVVFAVIWFAIYLVMLNRI